MLARLAGLPTFLLFFCACAGPSVHTAPTNAGEMAVHKASFERVRTAARDALLQSDFRIDQDQRFAQFDWQLIASQGIAAGTFGRSARVTLLDKKEGVEVWVVVESKASGKAGDLESKGIAAEIHKRIAARLR